MTKYPASALRSHKHRKTFMRVGVFLALLVAIPFFASSAFVSEKSFQISPTEKVVNVDSKKEGARLPGTRQSKNGLGGLSLTPFLLMPQYPAGPPAANPEVITIYQSDCTTEDTSFTLGQQVCAKVEGMPVSPGGQRRIEFVSSSNFVLASADVMSNGQTLLFTLPTGATENQGGLTVDNRGTWYVTGSATSDSSVRVRAGFVVSDPAQQVTNLGIYKYVAGTEQIAPGGIVTFTFTAVNQGPDAATNVVITDVVPTGTTYLLETQETGPTFTCTNPTVGSTGTTSCTIASLASGAEAQFRLRYTVNGGATNGTPIENTANISSATVERLPADNTYTAEAIVKTGGGGTGDICSINCPEGITQQADTVDGNGDPGAIVNFTPPSGNTECGVITVNHCNNCFFPVGSTTVTATATTGEVCEFIVNVTPANSGGTTISCPPNKTADAGANCEAVVNPGTPTSTGSNVTISGSRSDGRPLTDSYPGGITTITWTATSHDAQGEDTGNATCTQTVTVTVNDTTPPTVTAPADSSASADETCQAPVPDYVTGSSAADNCGSPIVTQSPEAGTLVGIGPHTVTVTATDDSGNSSSDTVVFTVNDTTAPTVTAPADSSANGDASCQAAVPDYTAGTTAADNCDTSVTLSQSPAAGTLVGYGPHTVTVTATDDAGNQASDTVVFTVNDSTPPTVTAPPDSSASADASCQAPVPDYAAGSTAADNCDSSVAVTQSPAAGTMVGKGPHTVTVTATDDAGNQSSDTVVFTVNDTTAPTITCPANITTGTDPNTCSASVNPGTATATDNCDSSPTVTGTRSDGLPLNAPYPKGTTTITWTATDDDGNSSSCAQTVTVNDTQNPTIILNGQTPSLWPPNHNYHTFQVTNFVTGVNDNCGPISVSNVVIAQVTSDESENGNGDGNTDDDIIIAADCKSVQLRSERQGSGNGRVYTILFSVKDAAGNTSTASAKVVVPKNPNQTPVDSGPNYTVTGNCP